MSVNIEAKISSAPKAPILLIAFNRPSHTDRTLSALADNDGALDSDLIAYVDGARSDDEVALVNKVVDVISSHSKGFKSLEIIRRNENIGLADNIIDAITTTIQTHGKTIVVEDDIVTSGGFLNYMNAALTHYHKEKSVWHVAGYTENIGSEDESSSFLWRAMHCWGWATWADRWEHFEKNPEQLISSFSKSDIKRFNLDGAENFWVQVQENKRKRINTWAIFWYATIFKNGGLCLNPYVSFVNNIGFDGTGVHCVDSNTNQTESQINASGRFSPAEELSESPHAFNLVRELYLKKTIEKRKRRLNKITKFFKRSTAST